MQLFSLLKINDQLFNDQMILEDYEFALETLELLFKEAKISETQYMLAQILCHYKQYNYTASTLALLELFKKKSLLTEEEYSFLHCIGTAIKCSAIDEDPTNITAASPGNKLADAIANISKAIILLLGKYPEKHLQAEPVINFLSNLFLQLGEITTWHNDRERIMLFIASSAFPNSETLVTNLLLNKPIDDYVSGNLSEYQEFAIGGLLLRADHYYQDLIKEGFYSAADLFYTKQCESILKKNTLNNKKKNKPIQNNNLSFLNETCRIKFILNAAKLFGRHNNSGNYAIKLYQYLMENFLGGKIILPEIKSSDPDVLSKASAKLVDEFLSYEYHGSLTSTVVFKIGCQLADLLLHLPKPNLEKLDLLTEHLTLLRTDDPEVYLLRGRYYEVANHSDTEQYYQDLFNEFPKHPDIGLAYFNFMVPRYFSPHCNDKYDSIEDSIQEKLSSQIDLFYSNFPTNKKAIILKATATVFYAVQKYSQYGNQTEIDYSAELMRSKSIITTALKMSPHYVEFYYCIWWLIINSAAQLKLNIENKWQEHFNLNLIATEEKYKNSPIISYYFSFQKECIEILLSIFDNAREATKHYGMIAYPDFSVTTYRLLPNLNIDIINRESQNPFTLHPTGMYLEYLKKSATNGFKKEYLADLQSKIIIRRNTSNIYFTCELPALLLANPKKTNFSNFEYSPNLQSEQDASLRILRTVCNPIYLSKNKEFILQALYFISQGFVPNNELDKVIKNFVEKNVTEFELTNINFAIYLEKFIAEKELLKENKKKNAFIQTLLSYGAEKSLLGYSYTPTAEDLEENILLLRNFDTHNKEWLSLYSIILSNKSNTVLTNVAIDLEPLCKITNDHHQIAGYLVANNKISEAISYILRNNPEWRTSIESTLLLTECLFLSGKTQDVHCLTMLLLKKSFGYFSQTIEANKTNWINASHPGDLLNIIDYFPEININLQKVNQEEQELIIKALINWIQLFSWYCQKLIQKNHYSFAQSFYQKLVDTDLVCFFKNYKLDLLELYNDIFSIFEIKTDGNQQLLNRASQLILDLLFENKDINDDSFEQLPAKLTKVNLSRYPSKLNRYIRDLLTNIGKIYLRRNEISKYQDIHQKISELDKIINPNKIEQEKNLLQKNIGELLAKNTLDDESYLTLQQLQSQSIHDSRLMLADLFYYLRKLYTTKHTSSDWQISADILHLLFKFAPYDPNVIFALIYYNKVSVKHPNESAARPLSFDIKEATKLLEKPEYFFNKEEYSPKEFAILIQLTHSFFLFEKFICYKNHNFNLYENISIICIKDPVAARIIDKFQESTLLQPGMLFDLFFRENIPAKTWQNNRCRQIKITTNRESEFKLVLPTFTFQALWLASNADGLAFCIDPLGFAKSDYQKKILRLITNIDPIFLFSQKPTYLLETIFYIAHDFIPDKSLTNALDSVIIKNIPEKDKDQFINMLFDQLWFMAGNDQGLAKYWILLNKYNIPQLLTNEPNAIQAKETLEKFYADKAQPIISMRAIFNDPYFERTLMKEFVDNMKMNNRKVFALEDLGIHSNFAAKKYRQTILELKKKPPKDNSKDQSNNKNKKNKKNNKNKPTQVIYKNKILEHKNLTKLVKINNQTENNILLEEYPEIKEYFLQFKILSEEMRFPVKFWLAGSSSLCIANELPVLSNQDLDFVLQRTEDIPWQNIQEFLLKLGFIPAFNKPELFIREDRIAHLEMYVSPIITADDDEFLMHDIASRDFTICAIYCNETEIFDPAWGARDFKDKNLIAIDQPGLSGREAAGLVLATDPRRVLRAAKLLARYQDKNLAPDANLIRALNETTWTFSNTPEDQLQQQLLVKSFGHQIRSMKYEERTYFLEFIKKFKFTEKLPCLKIIVEQWENAHAASKRGLNQLAKAYFSTSFWANKSKIKTKIEDPQEQKAQCAVENGYKY